MEIDRYKAELVTTRGASMTTAQIHKKKNCHDDKELLN